MVGGCEDGSELSGSIECWEFLVWLHICWLLKCYSIEDSCVYFTKIHLVSHKNKLRNDGGGIHFFARTVPLYMLRLLAAVLH